MIRLLFALSAFAAESFEVKFLDADPMRFQEIDSGAIVDVKSAKSKSSRAMKALKGEGGRKPQKPRPLPTYPDGTICANLGGRVTVGTMPDSAHKGFCRFRDGSMVDNLGLWMAARKRAAKP